MQSDMSEGRDVLAVLLSIRKAARPVRRYKRNLTARRGLNRSSTRAECETLDVNLLRGSKESPSRPEPEHRERDASGSLIWERQRIASRLTPRRSP